MRDQKWLELKILRAGWDSLQENEDLLNTARKLENKSSKLNTSFTDIGIIDDDVEDKTVFKQSNNCHLATVGYSSDEECDDVSENMNILQSDKTKASFLERRKFQLILIVIILFGFVGDKSLLSLWF